ncbi:SIR2 family protein [Salinisphaera sp. SPP-AMP-43]|uniref:SIR2 family protein n=1 Tax=Salinisphaera sp. SPP-AMP-43 TaxID=3121288 RepID=UPI003C6DCFC9
MSLNFLRAAFEEQLTVEHDPYTNKITIGATPFYATQILSGDDNAYRDEFSRWLSDIWLPEQEEILEQILSIHANRKRYEDLCLTFEHDQLIPLIGSGMSAPSGLPLWSEFLKKIGKHSSITEEEIDLFFSESKYEEAAEAIAGAMPRRLFEERIEHDLRFGDADAINGAVCLTPMLFDKLVLTTNLDNLLEQLYDKYELPFSEILSGESIKSYRRLRGLSSPLLLKLHGDYKSEDGRILSVAEYEAAYTQGAPVFEELSGIYRTNSVLCLGCSMYGDRTVRLLAEVAEIDPGIPKHYAFLKHPGDQDALLEREHFLTERDVFPIWFDGDHDESITALLVGLARHVGNI